MAWWVGGWGAQDARAARAVAAAQQAGARSIVPEVLELYPVRAFAQPPSPARNYTLVPPAPSPGEPLSLPFVQLTSNVEFG